MAIKIESGATPDPRIETVKKIADALENSSAFIKEVAKYFMDFLENDFYKRGNNRRKRLTKDEKNNYRRNNFIC